MSEINEMVQLDDALDIVGKFVKALQLPAEMLSVRNASGRIVSCDQISRLDLPPFDKSAMDGYAIPPGPLSRE